MGDRRAHACADEGVGAPRRAPAHEDLTRVAHSAVGRDDAVRRGDDVDRIDKRAAAEGPADEDLDQSGRLPLRGLPAVDHARPGVRRESHRCGEQGHGDKPRGDAHAAADPLPRAPHGSSVGKDGGAMPGAGALRGDDDASPRRFT